MELTKELQECLGETGIDEVADIIHGVMGDKIETTVDLGDPRLASIKNKLPKMALRVGLMRRGIAVALFRGTTDVVFINLPAQMKARGLKVDMKSVSERGA